MGNNERPKSRVPAPSNSNHASAHANGHARPANSLPLLSPLGFSRAQLVRLLAQQLQDLGYHESAQHLEQESGVALHDRRMAELRAHVLDAQWDKVLAQLPSISTNPNSDPNELRFLIVEQKFLELLDKDDVRAALQCVREELTPLGCCQDRLHTLSMALLCTDKREMRQHVGWEGDAMQARGALLQRLQKHIPPSLLVPEKRLEVLLSQAVRAQLSDCPYHHPVPSFPPASLSPTSPFDLFADHHCSHQPSVPCRELRVLEEHKDEVWFVCFSPAGAHLAAASKDGVVVVWTVESENYKVAHRLEAHEGSVSCVAFSPDSKLLLTCGADSTLRLWDVASGEHLRTFKHHSSTVTCVGWFPDSDRFVSGSLDKQLMVVGVDGRVLHHWGGMPIHDLSVSPRGNFVVALPFEKKILVYDMDNPNATEIIDTDELMTSVDLSPEGHHVVVNTSKSEGELQIIDIVSRATHHRLYGHVQKKFVIRSRFGGPGGAFVASGSEDSKVYIWNHRTGNLLPPLQGHFGTVNCVCWHPSRSGVLASASDDHTVRIWGGS